MSGHRLKGPVLGDFFFPEPEHWGLRGDHYLWVEMRAASASRAISATEREISHTIGTLFQELTGQPIDTAKDSIEVKRLDRGGMSGGYVDPGWWREVAQPLLSARLRAYESDVFQFREALEIELLNKSRRLPLEAVSAFLDDAAPEAALIAATQRHLQKLMPERWDKHYDDSYRSLESLARGLLRQNTYGRRALLKQATLSCNGRNTLQPLASGDLEGDLNATLDRVVELLLAAAFPPGERAQWRYPDRAQEVSSVVRQMAVLWRHHMPREPKAADGAPFSDSVIAIWAVLSGGETLSWKTVGQAMKNIDNFG
jgi:hypothetical protein